MPEPPNPGEPLSVERHDAIDIVPAQAQDPALVEASRADETDKKGEPHANRGTEVGLLITGGIALAISVLVFLLLYAALSHESHVYLFFWRSPIVPFSATLLFVWALAILALKVREIKRECKAFDLDLLPSDQYQLITIRDVQASLREINAMPSEKQNLLLVTRVWRALKRLRASGNSLEIADLLEYQANIDSAATESTYAAVKIFIWAIPVVGFIGTVLGISVAIGNFGDLVQQAGDVEQIKSGLGPVTGGLAVAFETTLLALVYSILVMFICTYVRKSEDDCLTRIEDYCVENLLNKLAIGDDKLVSEMSEAFSEAQESAMRQQAEVVESALSELQQRQEKTLERLNAAFDQHSTQSLTKMADALRELFEQSGAQQATRIAEMGQRLERGLRQLGESIETMREGGAPVVSDAAGTGEPAAAPRNGEELTQAFMSQAQELQETRKSLQALTQSLDHLATLEPFQQVMTNIQQALDALVPAIDELRKPRELRVIDAQVDAQGDQTTK